jgi:hypothetical protein
VPDRDIDILAREIDVVKCGAYPEVDRWVDLGKAAKTMHEPLRGEVWGSNDGENTRAPPLEQTVGSSGNAPQMCSRPPGRQRAIARCSCMPRWLLR